MIQLNNNIKYLIIFFRDRGCRETKNSSIMTYVGEDIADGCSHGEEKEKNDAAELALMEEEVKAAGGMDNYVKNAALKFYGDWPYNDRDVEGFITWIKHDSNNCSLSQLPRTLKNIREAVDKEKAQEMKKRECSEAQYQEHANNKISEYLMEKAIAEQKAAKDKENGKTERIKTRVGRLGAAVSNLWGGNKKE